MVPTRWIADCLLLKAYLAKLPINCRLCCDRILPVAGQSSCRLLCGVELHHHLRFGLGNLSQSDHMKPRTKEFFIALSTDLSRLYGFARQMNELDFAASLGGEFRGMQDAGWATTITAQQVIDELQSYMGRTEPYSVPEMRIALMLYCQLSEAGGVYESLKNIMGVVTS